MRPTASAARPGAVKRRAYSMTCPLKESADDFKAQAVAYARQFMPPHKAAGAVGRIKRSVQTGGEIPFESALALERELQQQLFQSEDAREGLSAYVEKRKPQFKGA